jgi:1-deoxy-D-xylulose-5-phosphate synthase
VKPVDEALVELAAQHRLVVTVEDNGRAGGVGAAVAQRLRDAGVDVPVRDYGIPQQFLEHAKRAEVMAEIGLTAQGLARRVTEAIAGLEGTPLDPRTVTDVTRPAAQPAESVDGDRPPRGTPD